MPDAATGSEPIMADEASGIVAQRIEGIEDGMRVRGRSKLRNGCEISLKCNSEGKCIRLEDCYSAQEILWMRAYG